MMYVERHFTKGSKEMERLCSSSRELYNRCCFILRQAWFGHETLPRMQALTVATRSLECCKAFGNTKTAKQTIRRCLQDWTNFFKALRAWKKDKTKFVKMPQAPKYKKKLAQICFFRETIKGGRSKKPLKGLIEANNDLFKIESTRKYKQILVTPKHFGFVIDIQYEAEPQDKENKICKPDKRKVCSIDVGLNNLMAITSDQHRPILVNGRIVKSFNQWFNRNPSKSRSRKRYWRLENYFHHASKLVVNHCLKHGIGTIVIGRNDGWKTGMNLGKRTNQNFQSIPFWKMLQKIQYKAKMVGIEVLFTEEAYTSKASALDNDPLPAYEKGIKPPVFSGKRKHRGLYVSKNGVALNADVNGSLNIGRKVSNVIPESVRIGDRSLVARPVIVNPLNPSAGCWPVWAVRLTKGG